MIEYRDATTDDGADVDALGSRVWLATFGRSTAPESVADYLATAYGERGALRRHLADPAYRFRVAARDGAVIGYCKLGPGFFDGEVPIDGALQLHQLYVDPAAHGTGVAAELLEWAKDHARATGHDALLLTVWEGNHRAQRFYAKHGFVHVGDYAFRVGAQIDRDLIMRLAL